VTGPVVVGLAHPGLLWTGAALASVPILIHLLFRRRHRVVKWAAMTWLLAALRKQRRRMQIENLILLILRCALIVLVGAAVARPAVQAGALSPLGGRTRSVVLVIDTSASMAAQQTGRRALDRARERAGKMLAELSDDSKVTLVASRDDQVGGAPRALLENASPSEARGRLASLVAGQGPNRLGAVFRLVGQKLDRMSGRKLVVFFTDLQRRDWRDDDGARHEDVYRALKGLRRKDDEEAPPVSLMDIGLQTSGNVVIADFSVEEGREAFAGSILGLSVRLVNYGPRPIEGTLSLFVTRRKDGSRENKGGQRVTLPPTVGDLGPQYKEVQLYQHLDRVGPARFEVVFDARGGNDRLPRDSRRNLALEVKPPVRFLPVRYVDAAVDILRDIGASSRVIRIGEAVSPAALATKDLDAFDAVVWADASPFDADFEERGVARLEKFVRRGGGLIFYLGLEAKADQINKLFFKERGKGLLPMRLDKAADTGENPVLFDIAKLKDHPLFFEATVFGSPEVTRYHKVKDWPDGKEEDYVVARYTNGDPAVIEHRMGRGRILIVTTTPDERWFNLNGSLLPAIFFFNAAHYLVAEDPAARNVMVGQPVRVELPAGARQVVVEPPEGAGGRTEEPVGDASRPFLLTATTHPGFYRITVHGISTSGTGSVPTEEVHFAAVNLDAGEGDLRRDDKIVSAYQGTRLRLAEGPEDILPSSAASAEGGELSRFLLTAVVVMLLLELLLAGRFGTRRATT